MICSGRSFAPGRAVLLPGCALLLSGCAAQLPHSDTQIDLPWLLSGSAITGQPVTMELDYLPGRKWQGKVDYVYPALLAAPAKVSRLHLSPARLSSLLGKVPAR